MSRAHVDLFKMVAYEKYEGGYFVKSLDVANPKNCKITTLYNIRIVSFGYDTYDLVLLVDGVYYKCNAAGSGHKKIPACVPLVQLPEFGPCHIWTTGNVVKSSVTLHHINEANKEIKC